jgi:hypothetical protein
MAKSLTQCMDSFLNSRAGVTQVEGGQAAIFAIGENVRKKLRNFGATLVLGRRAEPV